jgi:hypothetical protein
VTFEKARRLDLLSAARHALTLVTATHPRKD